MNDPPARAVAASPPPIVLEAFAVAASPVLLDGGEGRTWAADDVVLKPLANAAEADEEASWIASVLATLREEGFRVPRPIRAQDGRWVVAGWTAWRRVAGAHDLAARWPEVLAVADRFHHALVGVERPSFLDRRTHAWSIGDRVAWGEARPVVSEPFRPLLERLMSFLLPVRAESQVIHGDLSGNILFAPNQDPAVIDFSPYFRPAGFGASIVVVDAIAWYHASPTLVQCLEHVPDLDQLIARAAIYRLVTAARVAPTREPGWAERQVAAHEPLANLVGA